METVCIYYDMLSNLLNILEYKTQSTDYNKSYLFTCKLQAKNHKSTQNIRQTPKRYIMLSTMQLISCDHLNQCDSFSTETFYRENISSFFPDDIKLTTVTRT